MTVNPSAMPRGVEAGGVIARIVAYVIDGLVPALVTGLVGLAVTLGDDTTRVVALIVGGLLVLGWWVFVWWRMAVRGTSPGLQALGLQLVSIRDGRALGWGRVFLRQLILSALLGTVVPALLLLVFLLTHPQRQGWHDLAVGSVVVKAPRRVATSSGMAALARHQVAASATTTVGLPPRLAVQQGGFAGQTAPGSWSEPPPPPAAPLSAIPTFGPHAAAAPPPSAVQAASQPSAASYGSAPASQPSASTAAPWGALPGSQPSAATTGGIGVPASQPSAAAYGGVGAPASRPSSPVPDHSTRRRSGGATLADPGPLGGPVTPPTARRAMVESESKAATPGPETGAVGARRATQWVLTFSSGAVVDLDRPVLVGRGPVAKAGEDVTLVALGEDQRQVSKTHLLIDADQRGPYVVDRGSTNGTAVVVGSDFQPCRPGEHVRIGDGSRVSFGDNWFTVTRKA